MTRLSTLPGKTSPYLKTVAPMQQLEAESNLPFEIHSLEWMQQHRWQHQLDTPRRNNFFMIVWLKKLPACISSTWPATTSATTLFTVLPRTNSSAESGRRH
ncbi:hypothetical protein MKQ70_07130 [Chitinophaga sedimenti]|uniref:hypothetical protein n=1 Tax=Chitinophaga sedimenti TaxID=2033606 RepID=UPI0020062E23|nr:hypothetical protein [Chitinophaga sedimenti]MCK7554785.1 hypothetical protein [Chitinophaga sedimenti]